MASKDVDSYRLKDVIIEGVVPTNEEVGRGAYGKVFVVKYCGLECAAKEIHPILIEGVAPEEKKTIVNNFLRECYRCSVLRHPNIVQFLGIYFSVGSDLPIMVMELMKMSLTSFVKTHQSQIALQTKISILYDVSLGLSYLHGQNIIHRDLSPNNVMLTNQLVAKIGDLGVAKVLQPNRKARRLSKAPGTIDFMPPETLDVNLVYGTAVDVFSFAGIALFVFAEEWPTPSGQKRRNPATEKLVALTEVERRQNYIEKIPKDASILKELLDQSLHDNPDERPPIQDISEMIRTLKVYESTQSRHVNRFIFHCLKV